MHIGKILLQRGLITAEQLDTAEHTPQTEAAPGEVFVRLGYVSEPEVLKALAEELGMRYEESLLGPLDPKLVEGIPPKLVFDRQIVPVARSDGKITVATANPLALEGLDELATVTGCEIEPVVSPREQIAERIKKLFGVGADTVDRMVGDQFGGVEVLREGVRDESKEDLLEAAADASLINLVNQILIEALESRASDIHIEPFERQLRVRYRIDGVLHDAGTPAQIKMFQAAIVSRIKIMANLDVAEKRMPQDGRIMLRVAGREIDVRVSVIPTLGGEGVALRILERGSTHIGLGELGMEGDDQARFERFIQKPHGILLVTGPTGSGKTTTLYAALSKINTIDQKIITVEEPVEYQTEGICQIQVRPEIKVTFGRALRHILRHDPDVIMIGEIRDLETAEIAIQASLTGHLVFSTVHTNDAAGAITRLIDIGIEPYLVSSTLEGVMAQRLVRRICPNCKRERRDDDESVRLLAKTYEVERHYVGAGCPDCRGTGFRGRIGIFEVLTMSEPVRELALQRTSSSRIKAQALQEGMQTLLQDGIRKVRAGVTTLEEVLRVAMPEDVK